MLWVRSLSLFSLIFFAQASWGQTPELRLDLSSDHSGIPCQFSHDSQTSSMGQDVEAKVYICQKNGVRSILLKAQGKSPHWIHYSMVNGRYYVGSPQKITNAAGKTEFADQTGLRDEGEFEAIGSSKDFGGEFQWEKLTSSKGDPSSEFFSLKKEMTLSLNEKYQAILKANKEAKELSFKDSDGKKLTCERLMGSQGKVCSFFLCPKDTLVWFNTDQSQNGIQVVKLEGNSASSKVMNTVELSGVGEVQLGRLKSEYSETAFYNLYTSPYSYLKMNLKSCHDPKLEDFNTKARSAIVNVRKNLDEIPYKVLVKKIDGVLKTVATSDSLPKNYCQYEDVYYDKTSTALSDVKRLLRVQSRNKVYSHKEAQRVFDFFKSQQDLPWDYPNDGCFARAHLGALRAEEQLGIDMDKVWVQGEGLSPKARPDIKWSYHVAATINVKDRKGNVIPMVIDPALADKPLKVEEWTALFSISQKTPLRGSYNSPKLTEFVRPTYTITGNEVFNIYEVSSGYQLSTAEKKEQAESFLQGIREKR